MGTKCLTGAGSIGRDGSNADRRLGINFLFHEKQWICFFQEVKAELDFDRRRPFSVLSRAEANFYSFSCKTFHLSISTGVTSVDWHRELSQIR